MTEELQETEKTRRWILIVGVLRTEETIHQDRSCKRNF
jgi:hypothetical protein